MNDGNWPISCIENRETKTSKYVNCILTCHMFHSGYVLWPTLYDTCRWLKGLLTTCRKHIGLVHSPLTEDFPVTPTRQHTNTRMVKHGSWIFILLFHGSTFKQHSCHLCYLTWSHTMYMEIVEDLILCQCWNSWPTCNI